MRQKPGTGFAIDWRPSFSDTEYGMVGEIEAFSLTEHQGAYTLYPRLPNHKGVCEPPQRFAARDAARARADQLLEAFLRAFLSDGRRLRRPVG